MTVIPVSQRESNPARAETDPRLHLSMSYIFCWTQEVDPLLQTRSLALQGHYKVAGGDAPGTNPKTGRP
jgi:hypothetical protein